MQYLAELRRLATHCDFNNYLEEALCDRFVCGLRSESIQKWLLTEDKLDLKRALELAQGMESAHRNAKVFKEGNETSPEVPSTSNNVPSHPNVVAQMQDESEEIDHVVRHPRAQGTSGAGKSYRCGRSDHLAHNCIHKDIVCHNCKKLGQLAKVCWSQGRGPVTKNHWVEQAGNGIMETEGTVNLEEDTIFNVQPKTTPPYQVVVEINKLPVSMEIDTGAAVSIMSR